MEMGQHQFEIAPSILSGDTADVYFLRTKEILEKEGINPITTMEVFPSRDGILCGIKEVLTLLNKVLPKDNEVWALSEGDNIQSKEVVLRITAPYQSFGLYETAIVGILAHCSGWATAARECVDVAQGIPIICFGARHVHPLISGIMDYSAVVGGCESCSSTIGAKLAGTSAAGTMPHALILIIGDTADATVAFDEYMAPEVPRISLVDTFRDEAEESVIVARALGDKLTGVRLDTASELGGVTPDLVKKVRAKLDQEGFNSVKIYVSGGMDTNRIRGFLESGSPVDGFGIGSYISGARPIDFTADIHEIDKKPISKRGRTSGITPNPRLKLIQGFGAES